MHEPMGIRPTGLTTAQKARMPSFCPHCRQFAMLSAKSLPVQGSVSRRSSMARASLNHCAGNSVGLLPGIRLLVPTGYATAFGRWAREVLRPLPAAGAEAAIMGNPRKPWSKAKVRRVTESIRVGGYAAYRSRHGWSVWLSGDGAGPIRRRFFIPEESLNSRHPRWLSNRLIASLRQSFDGLEGVQQITAAEARELVRWCVRWTRTRPILTARQRVRAAAIGRWMKKAWRVPYTVHGAGYMAERSRRGWVVRLSSYSGRLRVHYLVPFRAFRPHGRRWYGVPLIAALRRSLNGIEGAQRTSDFKMAGPTGWAGKAAA